LVKGNQLQAGLLSQVAADPSEVGLVRVNALNLNRSPPPGVDAVELFVNEAFDILFQP
jgi:hypothetical protein